MNKLVVMMTVFLIAAGCNGVNPSPPAEEFTTNTNANNNDEQQTTDEQLVDFREDAQEVNDTLSVIEAESLVHDYLNLEAGSDTIVMFDSRLENGDYLISVFDLLEENKGTAQHKKEGLYTVNPDTGEIKKYKK
ncbi:putative nucleic acid-binding Zn-ribbon protein [Bacillus mesophilus]|uniref:PepSY domain-containing protein n=1 Tax=Bacillus mesophilus TaxID=1808955 RepID=A0A6M0Q2D0_9BACI|nr:hypothetical protein [Bacillus mesophilus]MBM7659575.1 putative nucleic acid-binding Zn-ribbon protein [Bacillus mesophilus]NEY70446.1 hypothetical protein [Bacillus mesophilus]